MSVGRGGEGWSEGFSFPLSNPVSLLKGLLPQAGDKSATSFALQRAYSTETLPGAKGFSVDVLLCLPLGSKMLSALTVQGLETSGAAEFCRTVAVVPQHSEVVVLSLTPSSPFTALFALWPLENSFLMGAETHANKVYPWNSSSSF